jgi:hypothetical protein
VAGADRAPRGMSHDVRASALGRGCRGLGRGRSGGIARISAR